MTLKTLIADDIDDVFMNVNEFAETVTLKRSTLTSGEITALPFEEIEQQRNIENVQTSHIGYRAWLIKKSSYAFGNGAVTPQQSDLLTYTDAAGESRKFEVTAMGDDPEFQEYKGDPHLWLVRTIERRV